MNLEKYISELLIEKGIVKKEQLNINDLCNAFDLGIVYHEQGSKIIPYRGRYFVLLDSRVNEIIQYEEFLHELSHFILELYNFEGIYNYKNFERKINHVAQILSCPMHLYEKTNDITEFSETFKISHRLAERRMKRIILKKN